MKILIIHCAYRYQGGESTVVAEEIKLLQSAGNKTRLLQFSNNSDELLKLLQLPFNIQAYIRTIRVANVFKPDVVHIHNLHFAGSASVVYAIKRKKIPLVVTLHNFRLLCPSGTLFFNGKPFLDSLKNRFYWSAVRKGVYKNSRLITFWMSASMQFHQWLHTWQLPNKYIVLSQHAKDLFLHSRLGVNEKQLVIKPNFSSQPVTDIQLRQEHFLFVGRLSNEKGVGLLLDAFAQLPAYYLRIAGDGPFKEKVIKHALQFSNITYAGILEKESIYAELKSCSALVFPSIWYEGMPLTIIESFAAGTPVIASNLGAMQSMIIHGYNGLHFNPDDKNDLALQLKKWMLLSEKERSTYSSNALETYNKYYTPEKNVKQLVAIYDAAINEN